METGTTTPVAQYATMSFDELQGLRTTEFSQWIVSLPDSLQTRITAYVDALIGGYTKDGFEGPNSS